MTISPICFGHLNVKMRISNLCSSFHKSALFKVWYWLWGSDARLLKMPLIVPEKIFWVWGWSLLALGLTCPCSTLTADPPDQGLKKHPFPRTPSRHLCFDEDGLFLSFPLLWPPRGAAHLPSCLPKTCTPGSHQKVSERHVNPWAVCCDGIWARKRTWSPQWKIFLRAVTLGQQLCSASIGIILVYNKSL